MLANYLCVLLTGQAQAVRQNQAVKDSEISAIVTLAFRHGAAYSLLH